MATSKQEYRALQDRAVKALEREFGEGKVAWTGGALGDAPEFRFTLQVGDPAAIAQTERALWDRTCKVLHPELDPQDFGRSFNARGQTYIITGCDPNRPKYAIKTKSQKGKVMLFPAASVVLCLRHSGARAA